MRTRCPRGLQQQSERSEAHQDLVDDHQVDHHHDIDVDVDDVTPHNDVDRCGGYRMRPHHGRGGPGTSPCTVDGYPAMALFSGSGAPLTVTLVNGLSVSISTPANASPSSFSVAPSSTAQFAFQFSDVPVGSEASCPTSASASVTMPDATTASPAFQLAIGPCGNGTIRVSPVYAGS